MADWPIYFKQHNLKGDNMTKQATSTRPADIIMDKSLLNRPTLKKAPAKPEGSAMTNPPLKTA